MSFRSTWVDAVATSKVNFHDRDSAAASTARTSRGNDTDSAGVGHSAATADVADTAADVDNAGAAAAGSHGHSPRADCNRSPPGHLQLSIASDAGIDVVVRAAAAEPEGEVDIPLVGDECALVGSISPR